ncbi:MULTISPECIES: GntR family transcriptional regulator [Rhizobium]|uniref:GntR family transcriptional regulator n=1 Tax=Rhizobium tropici TaxID=398 RepID=A0A6P1C6P7_RHITR|nr:MULTISPECIES: GntR family transcriptional regulator [Rhizobium]MBB4244500.1 DNA-binding GntR family transcriptional regulator [Rhizobium tropici]MBB5595702.1 DNA-binding GntR family transcriptional regulator [Rhizobium tropici]MBB6494840.1 DNA-binding GntR family transcriptional regulator [Rhizobium tropici]NEV12889.1 GntR family transcriptional regulator [Rhizobium tropici]TGE93291.1 GntR family transcriptional regulator [Rhizobium sp. SEMIA 4088]
MDDRMDDAAEESLAEETYRLLLAEILSARLAGGSVVQQRRLATRYAVSRSPMRHALGRLEGEGLLVRNDKGVLCVRVISLKDYLDSLAMRMLLEPSAAAAAAGRMPAATLHSLEAMLDAIEVDAEPDPEFVWQFDDALHMSVADASGNGFMAATISEMRRYTTIFERQMAVVRAKPGVAEHRGILAALADGDPEAARQAMTRHLEAVRQGVLTNF